MQFIYQGPAAETTVFGITFPKGEAMEATEDYAVKKLSVHPCFKVAAEESISEKLNVAKTLPLVAAATVEELDKMAEGETRETVIKAIDKRRAELQPGE